MVSLIERQPSERPSILRGHCARSVVFPYPVGAMTDTSGIRAMPGARTSSVLGTSPCGERTVGGASCARARSAPGEQGRVGETDGRCGMPLSSPRRVTDVDASLAPPRIPQGRLLRSIVFVQVAWCGPDRLLESCQHSGAIHRRGGPEAPATSTRRAWAGLDRPTGRAWIDPGRVGSVARGRIAGNDAERTRLGHAAPSIRGVEAPRPRSFRCRTPMTTRTWRVPQGSLGEKLGLLRSRLEPLVFSAVSSPASGASRASRAPQRRVPGRALLRRLHALDVLAILLGHLRMTMKRSEHRGRG